MIFVVDMGFGEWIVTMKMVLLKSWNFVKFLEMVEEYEIRKDGSRYCLSSFCMYKLYELVYLNYSSYPRVPSDG